MKPDSLKCTKLADHTTAATTTVTSAALDMAGYEWVRFLTSYGTAATDNIAKVQQSDDDGSSDAYSDLEGTALASGSSDEDISISVYKPRKRYLKLICARGTSSTLESIWAIQGGARKQPITHAVSGTIAHESHVSPAEGTA